MATIALVADPTRPLATLPPGTEVVHGGETYVLGRRLGVGGFSAVYRARRDGIDFALKLAAGPTALRQLEREGRITAQLSTTNLGVFPLHVLRPISIPGVDTSDMEAGVIRDMSRFGTTLTRLLERGPHGLRAGLAILSAVTRTLRLIHQAPGGGHLHGDVSPENIVYAADTGTALFIDFGVAQPLGPDGRACVARADFAFHPVYLAPEARAFAASPAAEVTLSPTADVYSLGLLLYGLLFEEPTPQTADHVPVLARNRVNAMAADERWDEAVRADLLGLFRDCLAADEAARLPDAAHLEKRLDDLTALLEQRSLTLPGLRERVARSGTVPSPWFGVIVDSSTGAAVRLDRVILQAAASGGGPLWLTGPRGSGKTTLLAQAARDLLDDGALLPVVIDAPALAAAQAQDADPLDQVARAVWHALVDRHAAPSRQLLGQLRSLLGLDRSDDGVRSAILVDGDPGPELVRAAADCPHAVFVFSGSSQPADPARAHTPRPLSAVTVRRAIRHSGGGHVTDRQAAALSHPRLLARLLALGPPAGALPDQLVRQALDDCHGSGAEPFHRRTLDLAYRSRVVERRKVAPDTDVARHWADEGLSLALEFVADHFAARFIEERVAAAGDAGHLAAVNHLWPPGVVALLRAGGQPLADRVRSLLDRTPIDAGARCDLLPANLFALTGEDEWAWLARRLGGGYLYQQVLDGYLAHDDEIVLYADLVQGRVVRHRVSEATLRGLAGVLPEAVMDAVEADLANTFRITP
jgi:hypothetical protein